MLALMPPFPTFAPYYESVHEMRRRKNITYNYHPHYLNAEHCRHIPEEECRDLDERHGRILNRQRKLNPQFGAYNVLVLFIQFPEDRGRPLGNMTYFNEMFNGETIDAVNPAGSLKEYLRYMSMNQYRVNFVLDTAGWQVAPRPASYYANGTGGKNGVAAMEKVFTWRLQQLDDAGFDWSPYDANHDGYLDHLVALHSGIGAEFGALPCSENWQDRIWSQACADSGPGTWHSSRVNITLGGFAMVSSIGSEGLCEYQVCKMGVIQRTYCGGKRVFVLCDGSRASPLIDFLSHRRIYAWLWFARLVRSRLDQS